MQWISRVRPCPNISLNTCVALEAYHTYSGQYIGFSCYYDEVQVESVTKSMWLSPQLKFKVENDLALLLLQFVGCGTVLRSWRYNLFLLFWSQNLNISIYFFCTDVTFTLAQLSGQKLPFLTAWGQNNNFLSKHISTFALLKKTALCGDVYTACISQTAIFKSLFLLHNST